MLQIITLVLLLTALQLVSPVFAGTPSCASKLDQYSTSSTCVQPSGVGDTHTLREFVCAKRCATREANSNRIREIDPWVADRIEEAARQAEQRRKAAEAQHRANIRKLEQNSPVTTPEFGTPPYLPYQYTYPYPYPYP